MLVRQKRHWLSAWVALLGLAVLCAPYGSAMRASTKAANQPALAATIAELTRHIPPRSPDAPTGSAFAASVQHLGVRDRERAVEREILHGNLPGFLRRLAPVTLTAEANGRTQSATVFVMPDYLAVGSDTDFLRIPMNLDTALAVAEEFGFVLPTRRIVDAIYAQSAYHFVPEPLTPGPAMSSTEYYLHHNDLIEAQARAARVPPGALVSGHKKDVVVTNRLAAVPGRIAIYGWQRLTGVPIQPLSTVHGACYEDYSHGIRLVSELAWQNGMLRAVREILQDAASAPVLSDEGAIRAVFAEAPQPAAALAVLTPGFCSSGSRDGN